MKSRLFKIACIMMLLVFVYATVASALSFTASMTPSSTTVAESTEFNVVIKIANLDVGSNGINSLSGYLKYDDEIFETISDSSIEGMNSWSPSYNAENSGKLTLTKTTFVKSDEQVFQVTFKTKSDIAGKTGKIQFTNIVASNSETEISASDISTTITIGTPQTNTGNTSAGGNNPITLGQNSSSGNITLLPNTNVVNNSTLSNGVIGSTNSSNGIRNGSSYINAINSSSNEDIPYTGVEDTVKILLVVCVAAAIGFYIKFEKVNKEIMK